MWLHYLGKLKIQIFCRCGRKCKQIAFLILSNFVIHPQILIFLLFKNSESFPILIANKIFRVTVLLLVYFCNQFMAPKICNSRRQCSICKQSTRFDKMFVFEGYTAESLTKECPENS